MASEIDLNVIKLTQNLLGKHIKRPPLSEKLLKKPPFRFLHDIIATVLRTTGFFEGLFNEEELVSDNVKDRDSKILFLSKVITVLGNATGKPITAKPSKIVAGQEPEKTNELLQCLGEALDKKISSSDAVTKYKEKTKSESLQGEIKVKSESKSQDKPAKKSTEAKKTTTVSSEKLTSDKGNPKERNISKNEKSSINSSKPKPKENKAPKKESPPKNTSQVQKNRNTNFDSEKSPSYKNEPNEQSNDSAVNLGETNLKIENNKLDESQNKTTENQLEDNGNNKLHSISFTITEKDLNSTLSLQEENVNNENIPHQNSKDSSVNDRQNLIASIDPSQQNFESNKQNDNRNDYKMEPRKGNLTESNDQTKILQNATPSVNNTFLRLQSVRPSSSRPGAPRLKEKYDNVVAETDSLLVAKVNIITENAPNEEEEEPSIVIVDSQLDTSATSELQAESSQHSHLVQQILDSQKGLTQVSKKTEIEWQFGAQKAKEATNQEFEQLRFNIQALSRAANPLGKLLDHIQEDVEVMRQELHQWTIMHEEASKELRKQKSVNEESLFPLHSKLKQFGIDIEEKRDKINDLKIIVHKNSARIEKLLVTGN